MLPKIINKPYLTPTEVAQLMQVSPITVRAWAAKGMLAADVTPGGHRRFQRAEVERFLRRSQDQAQAQPAPAAQAAALRILVVDDDRALVNYLFELLGGGATPVALDAAYDGFQAGQKMHTFGPDVVLLDFRMPGLNGVEVCQRIKQTPGLQQTRVIGMSGYLAPDSESAMLAAGAECCFGKPLDTARLLAILGVAA